MPVLEELIAVVLDDEVVVLALDVDDELVLDAVPVEVEEVVLLPPAPPEPSSSPQAMRHTKTRPKAKEADVFIPASLARAVLWRTDRGPPPD